MKACEKRDCKACSPDFMPMKHEPVLIGIAFVSGMIALSLITLGTYYLMAGIAH